MSVWKVFSAGVRQVFHHKKLLLLFYLPNLLLAYILAVPVRKGLQQVIGHSLASDQVARSVNLAFLVEFSRQRPGLISSLLAGLGAAMLVYLLLSVFLLGGAVSSLTLRRSSPWNDVFSDAALYFGRFLRLFLLSLVAYVAALFVGFVFSRSFGAVGKAIFASQGHFAGRVIGLFLTLVLLLLVNQIFDYAKILTTRFDLPGAWQAFRRSLRFIFAEGHFWRTVGIYYLITAVAVLCLVLYNGGASLLDAPNGLAISVLFLWQQLFILVKIFVKLLYYGSQAMYVNAQLPQVEPMEPTELLA